jgi:hypothetical protein
LLPVRVPRLIVDNLVVYLFVPILNFVFFEVRVILKATRLLVPSRTSCIYKITLLSVCLCVPHFLGLRDRPAACYVPLSLPATVPLIVCFTRGLCPNKEIRRVVLARTSDVLPFISVSFGQS